MGKNGIDYSNFAFPKPEKTKKNQKEKEQEEFCIMPEKAGYSIKRTSFFNHRHEVFFGRKNRQQSIKDGLVVFLTWGAHEGTDGVHGKNGKAFNLYLKKIGQQAWQDYYKKTTQDFINTYGKNYLN